MGNNPVKPGGVKKLPVVIAAALGVIVIVVYGVSSFMVPQAHLAPAAPQATATPSSSYFIQPYESTKPSSVASDSGDSGTAGAVLDFAVKFVLVLGLIYVTVWSLHKFQGRSRQGASSSSATVNVIDTVHLAQNKVIYLIEVGHKVLVVGSTPQNMSTLTELTDADTIAGLRDTARSHGPEPFSKYLNYFTSRSQTGPNVSASMNGSKEMVQDAISQLRRLLGQEGR